MAVRRIATPIETQKQCTVVLENGNPRADFVGIWTRRDLDVAYRLMLTSLQQHNSEQIVKSKQEAANGD